MDAGRRELNPDAPRTGWCYYLEVGMALLPLWWVPLLACSAVTRRARVLFVTTMGVGGLLAVVGWTALSERRRSTTVTYAVAR